MNVSGAQLETGPVHLEIDGVPAVVMSLSDYEDLLDVRDPRARARIAESHRDHLAGRFAPASELLGELDHGEG